MNQESNTLPIHSVPVSHYPNAIASALAGGEVITPLPATLLNLPEIDLATLPQGVPADIALVLGTSGSSGRPKQVMLSGTALRAATVATHSYLGGVGDWYCALPLEFVAGTMTIVRAVLANRNYHFVATDLHNLPMPSTRSYLSLVPVQLQRALSSRDLTEKLSNFQAVLLGGGALPEQLRKQAEAAGITVVTTYGMAETCGGCVYDGEPLPGVAIKFDKENFGPTQILLQTPTAFSGYLGDVELTNQVLAGRRVVTQDRGELIETDFGPRLSVLGRIDDVVIIGGQNVDLGAVRRLASAKTGDPLAGGVAVVAVPDDRWGAVLLAVSAGDWQLASVREMLAELPKPALPRKIVTLAKLPETNTGKLDYPKLTEIAKEEWRNGYPSPMA